MKTIQLRWAHTSMAAAAIIAALVVPSAVRADHSVGNFVVVWTSDSGPIGDVRTVIAGRVDDALAGVLILNDQIVALSCLEIDHARDGSYNLWAGFSPPSPSPTGNWTLHGIMRHEAPTAGPALGNAVMGFSRSSSTPDRCGASAVTPQTTGGYVWMDDDLPST